jgi:hypothetical protein
MPPCITSTDEHMANVQGHTVLLTSKWAGNDNIAYYTSYAVAWY